MLEPEPKDVFPDSRRRFDGSTPLTTTATGPAEPTVSAG